MITDITGKACPPYIQQMFCSPAALRARAKLRLTIAEQDRALGDYVAAMRNTLEADRLLKEAGDA